MNSCECGNDPTECGKSLPHMRLSTGILSVKSRASGSRMIEKWKCLATYSLGVIFIRCPPKADEKISWLSSMKNIVDGNQLALRSEERRVGKECRRWRSPGQYSDE